MLKYYENLIILTIVSFIIFFQINNIKTQAKGALEENEKLQKIVNGASKDSIIIEKKSEENKQLQECVNSITKEKIVLEKKVF